MTDQASNEQNQQPTEPTPSVLNTPPVESNPAEANEQPAPTGAPESIDGYQVEVENFNFDEFKDRKSTRLNSSHSAKSRMPSSA